MKTIIDVLREGNAKDRLAIIADITSIIGVSVASVVGGLLAITARFTNLNSEAIIGTTIFTLIAMIILIVLIIGFIYMNTYLSRPWERAPFGVRPLAKVGAWLLFAVVMIGSVAFFYTIITTIQFH